MPLPSRGLAATLACQFEVLARKAGNVHPGRAFRDMHALDLFLSAAAIGPVLEEAPRLGLGQSVLAGVRATRSVVSVNTNLGMLLLLAPLARVHAQNLPDFRSELSIVLQSTSVEDAVAVYQAIRLAQPSGLGKADAEDVAESPSCTLCEAMRLAAERDLIARQYVTAFGDVFDLVLPTLVGGTSLEEAILSAQLRLLATVGDSLIGRKLGASAEAEVKERARAVLEAGWPSAATAIGEFQRLDDWLRADGHRRNPGATADLICAGLFVAFRTGSIRLPLNRPWTFAALDTGVTKFSGGDAVTREGWESGLLKNEPRKPVFGQGQTEANPI